ncbi:hypothetical protein [Pleomorphomonas sp. PLEO]|uniref:hypothetical protein n=1 Tax=Pleomorphomonas sp. PLEO TaxID=3239306 RepID=UPI00351DF3A3
MTAPKAAVAFLSALLFVVILHLGLGTDIGSSLSTNLGASDHAVLRHSVLVRDGLRPVVAAEHGERTSAPPPQSPVALVVVAVVAACPCLFLGWRAVAGAIVARRPSAAHRPRAPPIAA